jgi:hypothetical protein
MKPVDCCLTLVFPPSLEDAVVGHLLDRSDWVSGFSVLQADGIGRPLRGNDAQELVRGRARQVVAQIVMNGADARALVALLRESLRDADMAWWITPIAEFGRFS